MINDFLEEGVSGEINLNSKNTFIRGLNKDSTLILILEKIKSLYSGDNPINPEELLIICSDEEEKNIIGERLFENIHGVDLISFEEFHRDYFVGREEENSELWGIFPERNKKVVFMIDPPKDQKTSEGFLDLLKKLFPENGAVLFFWEYEDFLDSVSIRFHFPLWNLINIERNREVIVETEEEVSEEHSEFETVREPTPPRIEEPTPEEEVIEEEEIVVEEKEEVSEFDISGYEGVIAELKNHQNSGHSFREFRLEIPEIKDGRIVDQIFQRIFRNEFETFLTLLEINRLNHLGKNKNIPSELLVLIDKWSYFYSGALRKIRKGKRVYQDGFEEMFRNLGILEFLEKEDSERLFILGEIIEGLGFPENSENLGKILDLKILKIFRKIRNDLIVENPEIVEPRLIPLEKKWSLVYLDNRDPIIPRVEGENPNLKKYEVITETIRKSVNDGLSALGFRVQINPLDDLKTKRELMEKIFGNEFEVFIKWMEVNRLNQLKMDVPMELINYFGKYDFYNQGKHKKIANSKKVYVDHFEEMFEDLGVKKHLSERNAERWWILTRLVEGLKLPENSMNLIETMESRIKTLSESLNDDILINSSGKPGLISLKKNRKSYFNWTKLSTPFEGEKCNKYREIIAEIKEYQDRGESINNYRIQIGSKEDRELLRDCFTEIFLNEFGVFILWVEVIKLNQMRKPIPVEIVEKIYAKSHHKTELMDKILREGYVYEGGFIQLFEELGIEKYLSINNPDIWGIIRKVWWDLNLNRDLENLMGIIRTRLIDESRLIKKDIYEKVEGLEDPKIVRVDVSRRMEYLDRSSESINSNFSSRNRVRKFGKYKPAKKGSGGIGSDICILVSILILGLLAYLVFTKNIF